MRNLIRAKSIIILFLVAAIVAGCSNSFSKEESGKKNAEKHVKNKAPKREVFCDPDSFDSPRIQFVRSPRNGQDSIWSVKTDGTDLRLVLSSEELFQGDANNINGVPMRSPDNRYLLVSTMSNFKKYLFDLKENTRELIISDSSGTSVAWFKNSKKIHFGNATGYPPGGERIYGSCDYDVVTKKLTLADTSNNKFFSETCFRFHTPTQRFFALGSEYDEPVVSDSFEIIPEGVDYIDEGRGGICIFDSDWNKIEFHEMRLYASNFAVSPDGNKFIYGDKHPRLFVYDTKKKKRIFSHETRIPFVIFSENSDFLYISEGDSAISRLTFSEGKITSKIALPFPARHLALINLQGK